MTSGDEAKNQRGYSAGTVARRVLERATRRLLHARGLLLLAALGALLIVIGPSWLTGGVAARGISSGSDDAAEQYMRALRDRDSGALFLSLSPDMRQALEQRYGRMGPAAVAALFSEQDRRGERYASYHLIGGYETVQGESLRFYVVQAQRGGERRDIPYTLTMGSDGMVQKIE